MQHSHGGDRRPGHQKLHGWGRENWNAVSHHRHDKRHLVDLPRALGPAISEIFFFEIDFKALLDKAAITELKDVASYSLTDEGKIIVPGKPAAWSPMDKASRLPHDRGEYYKDENAARFQFQEEPMLSAVLHLQPEFITSGIDIDIVTGAHTLDRLWRFANGSMDPAEDSFAFLVQIIGNTAFFIRREHRPDALLQNMHGHGYEFLAHNTDYGENYKQSKSHQRVTGYTVGGLKMLVRYEVDCFDAPQEAVDSAIYTPPGSPDLIKYGTEKSTVTIEPRGEQVAQADIVDIKTRSDRKDAVDIMKSQLPRLWIRQITKSVLALHDRGFFQVPKMAGRSNELKEWEAHHKESIARYAALMRLIKKAAMECKDGIIEVRCCGSSSLDVHTLNRDEVGKWNVLSDASHKKWAGE